MSSRIVPTEYKEPNESIAPLGFASSILSGNTVEGGLRSLTYKSVYASQLIEELELAKRAVVPSDFQLSRIMEKDIFTESKLQDLRAEIATIKGQNTQKNKDNDEKIMALGAQLEQELLGKKKISQEFSKSLKEYQTSIPLHSGYTVRKMKTKVNVERMEDAKGFDSSIYQRAKERRAEEERSRAEQAEVAAQELAMSEAQEFDLSAQQTPPEGIFSDIQNLNGLDQREFDPTRIEGEDRQFPDADQVLMHDNFGGMSGMDSPNINQQMNQQMQQQINMDHDQLQHTGQHDSPQVSQMQQYPMDSMSFPMGNQGMGPNPNQEAGNIGFGQGYPMSHNVDQYNAMNQLHGNGLDNPYMQNQPPF